MDEIADKARIDEASQHGHTAYGDERTLDIILNGLERDGHADILFDDWTAHRLREMRDARPLSFGRIMARVRKHIDQRTYDRFLDTVTPPGTPYLATIVLSEIETEIVEWLWDPYVPLGKITLIEGDPGLGKTFLVLTLAAAVTHGFSLPDQHGRVARPTGHPGNVLYITAEDGIADTIRPRAEAAGADLQRFFAVTGWATTGQEQVNPFSFEQLPLLEQKIQDTQARLVILDPLQAFLGAHVDMFRPNEVRPLMMRLGMVLAMHRCSALLVRHWTKSPGGKAAYRGQGSIDFTASARSVLIVGESPDDETRRIMAQSKNSLKPKGKSLGFSITDHGIEWCGTSDFDAESLSQMQPNKRQHQRRAASEWLKDYLYNGPALSRDIYAAAEAVGLSERTLNRAKSVLGVLSKQEQEGWYWRLPSFSPWERDDGGIEI